MSQQSPLMAKVAWAALGRALPVKGGDPALLLSTGEATSGALCPFCLPVQERHRHGGVSPAKGCRDVKRTGASVLKGEAERRLRGDLTSISQATVKKAEPDSSPCRSVTGQEAMGMN